MIKSYNEALMEIHSYADDLLHNYLDILQELSFISHTYVNLTADMNLTGNDMRELMVILAVNLNKKYTDPNFSSYPFEDAMRLEFKSWLVDQMNKESI